MNRQRPARPVFFNLTQIHMPVGAITSIAYRITGVVLALGLPFFLYLLHLSLGSAQSYERLTRIVDTGLFKVALVAFCWALSHHLLAGVRHLLMDIDIGSYLIESRRSAWGVNIGGAVLALVAAGVVL